MNGFLCVLKPPGMTSSDVVVRVRRKLGRGAKVGHAARSIRRLPAFCR